MEDFIAYGFYAKRVEDLNEQVQLFMTSGNFTLQLYRSRSERCHRSLAIWRQRTSLTLSAKSCLYLNSRRKILFLSPLHLTFWACRSACEAWGT